MPTPDWGAVFALTVSPLELAVRGSAIYWFLFLVFRFILRRDLGNVAMVDVLLLMLVADAAQNAMSGGYQSVTDGIILTATILGWNFVLDWLVWRFAAVARVLQPAKILLVSNGRLQRRNMRREFLTEEELMAKLRENGVERVDQVKHAYMEGDGEISVIRRQG